MEPDYFIEDGVHRAIAAKNAGLAVIPAILFESGTAPRRVLVALSKLYSPRLTISRSDPRHNFTVLEAAMRTVSGRMKIQPISIQVIGALGSFL